MSKIGHSMISYGRQDINQTDIDAVEAVLRSDFLTQGPAVKAFEEALSKRCQVGHAVAVNSATSALHLACMALGMGPGDWLWTSPITFVASANCARYCGADVDFVDIDPITFNMSPLALSEKLKKAKKSNKLPKVVVAVHMCGQPCDMAAIHALSKEYGFKIIEDASHAVGASEHGVPVGSCQYSDITVMSFHPVKIITTAEGGAALTQQADLAAHMMMHRSHGITRDPVMMTEQPEGDWVYQQIGLGFNYRMTDLQGALGSSQLTRLDQFVAKRRWLASEYHQRLKEVPIHLPQVRAGCQSSWHLYVVQVQKDRKQVFDALRARGIGVNVHYVPVYRQPYYAAMGYEPKDYPNSEAYYKGAITLPLYAGMTERQLGTVVNAVQEVLS
jgi:UDP-4-amino-4,6-dideoxy-N-acetyl-beta-L-altrosamine transaminase